MPDVWSSAYRIRMKTSEQSSPAYSDYLIHYGVPGQKWGVRRYQNEDGSYTNEGAMRRLTGNGRGPYGQRNSVAAVRPRVRTAQAPTRPQRQSLRQTPRSGLAKQTPEQIKARRARAKKIIAITAGVTIAAALGYAAYKSSTNLRDQMRKDVLNNMSKGYDSINTLNSKYWNSVDRSKYSAMTKARAQFVADNTTRRDAVLAKLYEKTGVRLSLPQSRAKVLAERRSQNELANFFREAENRGYLNKQIHEARSNLRVAQDKLSTYKARPKFGNSKNYEQMWTQRYEDNVKAYKEQLDKLLQLRIGRAA